MEQSLCSFPAAIIILGPILIPAGNAERPTEAVLRGRQEEERGRRDESHGC